MACLALGVVFSCFVAILLGNHVGIFNDLKQQPEATSFSMVLCQSVDDKRATEEIICIRKLKKESPSLCTNSRYSTALHSTDLVSELQRVGHRLGYFTKRWECVCDQGKVILGFSFCKPILDYWSPASDCENNLNADHNKQHRKGSFLIRLIKVALGVVFALLMYSVLMLWWHGVVIRFTIAWCIRYLQQFEAAQEGEGENEDLYEYQQFYEAPPTYHSGIDDDSS